MDQLVTFLSLHIPNPDGNPQIKALREASSVALLGVAAVVMKITHITHLTLLCAQIKEVQEVDGPFYQSLGKSLNRLNVQRQAYHGGAFIGNHVHKLLQVSDSLLLHKLDTNSYHSPRTLTSSWLGSPMLLAIPV